MATLVLGAAGAAIGSALLPAGFSFLGATLTGAAIGRAVGTLAGAYIDQELFGPSGQTEVRKGPRLSDLSVTASTEGAAIPRVYGRARIGGQMIWATNFEEEVRKSSAGGSGKGLRGGAKVKTYFYYANFAIALAEGPITRVGRVWADGKDFDLTQYTHRIYYGADTQLPDSLITAKEGAGNAPAYRGLAYIVFERMPLEKFGNRIPQLTFEVVRAVDAFESEVKAVTLIPAAGEFAYEPTEVRRYAGGGVTFSENRHTHGNGSNFTVAVDQLEDFLPNARTVSLFVTWFGSDLRAGNCTVTPKVEANDKETSPLSWSVSGLSRAAAQGVSLHQGRPAFGGTPSDNAVIHAIQELKARGFSVAFTPFMLMDIPAGNSLTDPYTGAGSQPAYPWRGRITCSPAPGVTGTPDKTAAAAAQINSFVGTAQAAHFSISEETVNYSGPAEWSYRRMILHCAHLCKAAGGVDAFFIGSELRGLTQVRESAAAYPFVSALTTLAGDVKSVLSSFGTKVSYAADWSEYYGHQPQDGSSDIYFHLDPLWSSANIDAVGIDVYWPLSDWRDGTGHLDYLAGHRSIHDLSYLRSNIAGGEGYSWYYASSANRDSQTRTTIADGGYNKPWVFRFKDIKNWWLNQHYNRPGGSESASPTAWAPQSKPFWFTELGCPAADKGSNQPNVFYDPKSAESFFPYYSKGVRDDLIQRRFLRAFLEFFDPSHADYVADANPISAVYSGRMVTLNRMFVYTWDARPYPAFPNNKLVWTDTANWTLGHWLTGRAASAPLAETVRSILNDYGFADHDTSKLSGIMHGYAIDQVMPARDVLQPLELAFFFDSYESQGKIRFAPRGQAGSALSLTRDALVETGAQKPRFELVRGQETELPFTAKVAYVEGAASDYRQAAVEARRLVTRSGRVASAHLPIVTDQAQAQEIAEVLLHEAWSARERAAFSLPPSRLALDPADIVTLDTGERSLDLRLTTIGMGEALELEALGIERHIYERSGAPERAAAAAEPITYGPSLGVFLDLPLLRGDEAPHAGYVAAHQIPWPGGVAFYRSPSLSNYELKALPTVPAIMGVTEYAFYSGPASRFDYGNILRVKLDNGELSSVTDLALFNGANTAAVQNADGEWEVIQFRSAALVLEKTYDLSVFLRGQAGTERAMRNPVAAGARFVLIDPAVVQADMTQGDIGLAFNWKYGPSPYDIGHPVYQTVVKSFRGLGLRPFSPEHVRGKRSNNDLIISWVRRTRLNGDSWDLAEVPLGEDSEAYEADVMSGPAVKRTLSASAPSVTYTEAQQISDFGAVQANYTVRVYQKSAVLGRGEYREAVV